MKSSFEIIRVNETPRMSGKKLKFLEACYTLKERESGGVLSYDGGSGEDVTPCLFTKKQAYALKKAFDQLVQNNRARVIWAG